MWCTHDQNQNTRDTVALELRNQFEVLQNDTGNKPQEKGYTRVIQ
jgi:hypothetical protein